MANTIQIKRTTNSSVGDAQTAAGELVWTDNHASAGGANGSLYIGDTTGAARKIGGIGTGAVTGATNLSATQSGDLLTVESSTGSNVDLPAADNSNWGVMTDDQATKLSGIETSADVNVDTNITGSTHASQYTINSSTGTGVTVAEASDTIAGVMTVAHHDKLDGIENSADVTDATNVAAALSNGVAALTSDEVTQLSNIGSSTIHSTDWAALADGGNQSAAGRSVRWDSNGDLQIMDDDKIMFGSEGGDCTFVWNNSGSVMKIGADDDIAINIGGDGSGSLVTIGKDLTVTGDLTVSGTTTTVDSTTVATGDSLIKLAKDQDDSADAVDFGIYGVYGESDTAKYAGIFRDQSVASSPWTFFHELQADPGTTVNTGGTGYAVADVTCAKVTATELDISGDADIDGTLEADAITVNGTALDTHIAGVTVALAEGLTGGPDITVGTALITTEVALGDDDPIKLGSNTDAYITHAASALGADAETPDFVEGTSDHLGYAANSLVISNVTNDGDIAFFVSDGGHSRGVMLMNGDDGNIYLGGGATFNGEGTTDIDGFTLDGGTF